MRPTPREAVIVGPGRRRMSVPAAAHTIGFEWMSFSGRVRLSGADAVLPPSTSFWEALPAGDRERIRQGLAQAAHTGDPLELTCRLDTWRGARPYLLKGDVVAGEPAMAPRVMGVLVELLSEVGGDQAWPRMEASAPGEPAGLAALLEGLAGAMGDDPSHDLPTLESFQDGQEGAPA